MDNTTAVAYVNKKGGTHSKSLCNQALELWAFLIQRGIQLTATHIPGVLNVGADKASREFNPRTEWTLDKQIFHQIIQRFFLPLIDLFASRLNNQLPHYYSRLPDPGALGVDAFLHNWGQGRHFAHPPVILFTRVLSKIQEDRAQVLLLAPFWPGQPWFPLVMQMIVDYPLRLPIQQSLLFLPFDKEAIHPLWRTLQLTVWPLSGNVSDQKAFRQKLLTSCVPPGVKLLRRGIWVHGGPGQTGVPREVFVPFQHL